MVYVLSQAEAAMAAEQGALEEMDATTRVDPVHPNLAIVQGMCADTLLAFESFLAVRDARQAMRSRTSVQ